MLTAGNNRDKIIQYRMTLHLIYASFTNYEKLLQHI